MRYKNITRTWTIFAKKWTKHQHAPPKSQETSMQKLGKESTLKIAQDYGQDRKKTIAASNWLNSVREMIK